jgi:DNA polymerase III delta subunit
MIIIHGENINESRKQLDSVLTDKKNIKRLEGKSLKPDSVSLLFESTELFAEEKTIVIENCKAIPKQSLEIIAKVKPSPETSLIFWQNGNYDARLIKKFPKAQVFNFPLPKYYFSYLDNLLPGKGGYIHSLYISLLDSFVPEQIFFSTVKRIRHLIVLKSGVGHEHSEMQKMTDWQKNKLSSQARNWTLPQLHAFYKELYKTELAIKSSNLPTGLKIHLDNLILTTLQ